MKAYIYKRNSPTLDLVAVAEVVSPSATSFTKSASTLRQTVLKLVVNESYDSNNILVNYPIIFEINDKPLAFGLIKNIRNDVTASTNVIEVTVALGSDGLEEEVPTKLVYDGSTNPSVLETITSNYYHYYQQDVDDVVLLVPAPTTVGYLVSPDGLLGYGQCIRQLLKQGFRENVTLTDTNIVITYEYDPMEHELNAEDSVRSTVTLAKDTYNKYVIYNEENLTQTYTAYLDTNGNVLTTPSSVDRPNGILTGTEKVSLDNFNQDYCNNALKKQAYSNAIELDILVSNYIFSHIFKAYIFDSLGTSIVFRYNGNKLNTYIDELIVKSDFVTLKLGVSQTRLLDKLKGE